MRNVQREKRIEPLQHTIEVIKIVCQLKGRRNRLVEETRAVCNHFKKEEEIRNNCFEAKENAWKHFKIQKSCTTRWAKDWLFITSWPGFGPAIIDG